jgi:hypothetical protein
VELYVIVGRAEDAVNLLDTVDKERTGLKFVPPAVAESYFKARLNALRVFNPQKPMPGQFDQDPISRFRFWRLVLALITGDFDTAIATQQAEVKAARENLENYVKAAFPNGLPASTEPFTTFDLPVVDLLARLSSNPVHSVDSILAWQTRYIQSRGINNYRFLVINQSDRHAQLGLIYLEQGDIRSAKLQFKEALKGPEIKGQVPARLLSQSMLKLLD